MRNLKVLGQLFLAPIFNGSGPTHLCRDGQQQDMLFCVLRHKACFDKVKTLLPSSWNFAFTYIIYRLPFLMQITGNSGSTWGPHKVFQLFFCPARKNTWQYHSGLRVWKEYLLPEELAVSNQHAGVHVPEVTTVKQNTNSSSKYWNRPYRLPWRAVSKGVPEVKNFLKPQPEKHE